MGVFMTCLGGKRNYRPWNPLHHNDVTWKSQIPISGLFFPHFVQSKNKETVELIPLTYNDTRWTIYSWISAPIAMDFKINILVISQGRTNLFSVCFVCEGRYGTIFIFISEAALNIKSMRCFHSPNGTTHWHFRMKLSLVRLDQQ